MTLRAYLDWNATAPIRPEARTAMTAALDLAGNPSSVHGEGRAARALIEDAREAVASLIGAGPDQIVFTSGGSEANALALGGSDRRVLASAIEHDSVLAHAVPERIKVTAEGVVDLDDLEAKLASGRAPVLVSVMLANNETGAIQPLADVVRIARAHGALVHTDAAQAAGRMPVDFLGLGADLMSVSAHKLGGPQGVGALVIGERALVAPMIRGGGQERGRRAGTENVAGIVGFGAAAIAAAVTDWRSVTQLRCDLEQRAIGLGAEIFADQAARLPNTTSLRLPGIAAETLVIALDLEGVAVSAGAACSSGKVKTSPVLKAMGMSEQAAGEAIRASLGWTTTAEEIDLFIAALGRIRDRIGRRDLRAAA
ncbi:MAG: cysteine desulfurase [Alphaproteobacteria bacterium]|nr:cysteine desulfurase [Alphaproteobacteria bacterium]